MKVHAFRLLVDGPFNLQFIKSCIFNILNSRNVIKLTFLAVESTLEIL